MKCQVLEGYVPHTYKLDNPGDLGDINEDL